MTADAPASRTYGWDQENRLVSIEAPSDHLWTFEYDGETRRVRMTEKLGAQAQTTEEVLIWCGGQICQRRDTLGTTVARNYFQDGFEEAASEYYYARDHLGSIRSVLTANGQSVTAEESFGLWGTSSSSSPQVQADFGFTGHLRLSIEYLDELSLPQYRGYEARLGRWLSRDPIGYSDGPNLYGYVQNQPAARFDPLGLSAADVKFIRKLFDDYVRRLTEQGLRHPNPFLNNLCANLGGGLCDYKKCKEQAKGLLHELEAAQAAGAFDDTWDFYREEDEVCCGKFGHAWLSAVSRNESDPGLTLDPWADEFETRRVCGSQEGLSQPHTCANRGSTPQVTGPRVGQRR